MWLDHYFTYPVYFISFIHSIYYFVVLTIAACHIDSSVLFKSVIAATHVNDRPMKFMEIEGVYGNWE